MTRQTTRLASLRPASLLELRARYVDGGRPLPSRVEAALQADPRAGARAILDAIARRRRDNRSEGQRLRTMLRFETALWDGGVTRIAGVDEAGMSPLAGPVAAAAVILAPGTRIAEVDDSKRLDADTRERLAPVIKQRAVAWAVAFAEVEEIDRINIYWAGLAAMRRAIAALAPAAEHLSDRRPQAPRRRLAATANRRAATPRVCRSRRPRSSPRPPVTRRCVSSTPSFLVTASPSTRAIRCRRTRARS